MLVGESVVEVIFEGRCREVLEKSVVEKCWRDKSVKCKRVRVFHVAATTSYEKMMWEVALYELDSIGISLV